MPLAVIALLGALSAVGPFALDLYLPAFPQLATDLGISASQAQLSMTACMIGLACGQLMTGIFSDALGRRKPLIVGISMFTLFSIACVVAPNIWLLIVFRFIQGLGGGAGVVIARAVIRDRCVGEQMVKMLTTVMMLLGLAPIAAPLAGGLLTQITDWRGIFVVLSIIAASMLIGALFLPETLPAENRRSGGGAPILADFKAILKDPLWRYGAGSVAFVCGTVFVYISGSAFILQDIYGFSPLQYGVFFACNGTGFIIFSQLNRVAGRFWAPAQRQTIAIGGVVLSTTLLALAAILPSHPLWLVLPGFFLTTSSHGFGSPNGIAIAMQNHGQRAGSASALQGLTQFAVGALAVPFAGESVRSVAIAIGVMSLIAVIFRLTSGRQSTRRTPTTDVSTAAPAEAPEGAPT